MDTNIPPSTDISPPTDPVVERSNKTKIIAVGVVLLFYIIGMSVLVNRLLLRKKTISERTPTPTIQQIPQISPTPTPICPEGQVARSIGEAKADTCALYLTSHTEPASEYQGEVVYDEPRTGSAIGSLPVSIGDLTQLKVLQANRADLMSVPSVLHLLEHLTHVSLSTNNFRVIPTEILSLTNLIALDMSRNMIVEVPASIGKLTHLEHLFLYGNRISELPPEIGDLSSLTLLQLSENRITKLPDTIKHLSNLRDLYVEGNPLSSGELERIKSLLPNTTVHYK